MSALLQIAGLTAHYGDFQALFGVDLTLDEGQTLAIIGANGAGKTTLMRAITGVARVTAGTVTLAGADITRLPAPDILTRGIAMVPEGAAAVPLADGRGKPADRRACPHRQRPLDAGAV
jgi:branched-chain amino acid transport system ATP-binding protein